MMIQSTLMRSMSKRQQMLKRRRAELRRCGITSSVIYFRAEERDKSADYEDVQERSTEKAKHETRKPKHETRNTKYTVELTI